MAVVGYYVYTDAYFYYYGDVARITSRTINPTSINGNCLTWWYHMAGQSMGTMNVYLNDLTAQTSLLLWSRTGDQSGEWLMFERTIKSTNKFTVCA